MTSPSRDAFDTFARQARTSEAARDSASDHETPAVSLLTETLREAAERGASDIHVEPSEHDWRIRLRVDGALHVLKRPPPHLRDAFVTRIKVLARMDIAERRMPQDGRLRLTLPGGRIGDYRVNSLPTLFGEKLVLRRLDALPPDLSLAALGLDDAQSGTVESAIRAPHGLILVTGPTGSGKTLSLYCFLQMLNAEARNVCSVEDPVEIQLAGINQVSVREKAGLTFAVALRAFMRQDPDVIMVGEIRDLETADIAIKAAQTGHMVMSTLHTNDAPTTLTRLLNMGVAPFNIASSVLLITAQRLARRLCENCKAPAVYPRDALLKAGFKGEELDGNWKPYRAVGCSACTNGYKGRLGIYQVMPISEEIQKIILSEGTAMDIAAQAQRENVRDLRQSGLIKVRAGLTTLEEVISVTNE